MYFESRAEKGSLRSSWWTLGINTGQCSPFLSSRNSNLSFLVTGQLQNADKSWEIFSHLYLGIFLMCFRKQSLICFWHFHYILYICKSKVFRVSIYCEFWHLRMCHLKCVCANNFVYWWALQTKHSIYLLNNDNIWVAEFFKIM